MFLRVKYLYEQCLLVFLNKSEGKKKNIDELKITDVVHIFFTLRYL